MSKARMAMHLERVGGWFVAAMAVLLAVAGNAAFAQEHKTYRCKVVDVVTWDGRDGDGRLRPDSNPNNMTRNVYDGVIIDTMTGAVSFHFGTKEQWKVIKLGHGRGGYDYYLNERRDADLRGLTVNQFIQIRTWGGESRFQASWLDSYASGPCEVVR